MTIFSDTYEKLTAGRNIRVYDAAQYCGISPASLYQIFSGKRKPPNQKLVEDLTQYLQFSPSARQELLDAYKKTVIGEDAFERRSRVEAFLKTGNRLSAALQPSLQISLSLNPDQPQLVLLNTMQVLHAFFYLMNRSSETGEILKLRLDASCSFLEDLASHHPSPSPKIRQIFGIAGQPDSPEQLRSIFCILEQALLLYTNQPDYEAFTIYENKPADSSVFPYYGVCQGLVILVSRDFSQGFLCADTQLAAIVETHFDNCMKHAGKFLRRISDPVEQFEFYRDNLKYFDQSAYLFDPHFCAVSFMDRAMLEKYLNRASFLPVMDRDAFLQEFDDYTIRMRERIRNKNMPFFYVSSSGIRRFLQTGEVESFLARILRSIDPEDRIILVQRMMDMFSQLKYRPFKPGTGPEGSSIEIWSSSSVGLIAYRSDEGEHFFFCLLHDYLLRILQEYFSTLDKEAFQSPEEFRQTVQKELELFTDRTSASVTQEE